TGMNTLLHAPIQASAPQTEWHDVDNGTQRNRHDTTLLFSEENEMDMTASHTAVITRNQADDREKIDVTSFLMGLNSGKADTGKEFPFFSDPANHSCPTLGQKEDAATVKKIDFNEFLVSLKANEKAPNPIEGPEKENIFFVPSQVAGDMAQSLAQVVCSHEPQDTCNVTKVFRGQDDGMEMTKCQASDVKMARAMPAIPGSVTSETVFRDDKTVGFSTCDDMEMTGNYTDIIYKDRAKEMSSWQSSERQERPHTGEAAHKVLPTCVGSERDFSDGRAGSSEEGVQNPHAVDGWRLQGAPEPFTASLRAPPKGRSQVPPFSEKSVVFPSGENMDLTGSCGAMVSDHNINPVLPERKAVPAFMIQGDNKMMSLNTGDDRGAVPAAPANRTIVFAPNQDDMEMTVSHTTAVNNVNGFENQE
ncbi:KNL1 protein, partial [Centropus unirufus]|nr:KNL1 protein [Centropus unirufus]